jgi:uncharacterized protein YjbJ (UPF0337 family)
MNLARTATRRRRAPAPRERDEAVTVDTCPTLVDEHIYVMNKAQKAGAGQNVKGRIKEAAGIVSGNKKAETGGLVDRVLGAAKYAVGRVRHEAAKKLDR